MLEKTRTRPDLLLLLSLLAVVFLSPVLDRGNVRQLFLALLVFVPVIISTVKLSQIKVWMWPAFILIAGAFTFALLSQIYSSRVLSGTRWSFLAAFYAFAVIGLFSYLRNARSISTSHLYTAVSIYLLLGFLWFALYSAIDNFWPGAIQHNNSTAADRSSELLYFSLVTLSTIGYGDVVPIRGEVRMLAAMEGIAGVLYIAITVALLVSAYRLTGDSR